MSSNNNGGQDGSPSAGGEKRRAEKQLSTPPRRYEKRQKRMSLELTLGPCGDGGSGPYVGIPRKKRCCACEVSSPAKKRRVRTKKAAGPSSSSIAPPLLSLAVKSEPPQAQESVCEACKAVFTTNEGGANLHICAAAAGGGSFDVGKLIQFHNVITYVKRERDDGNPHRLPGLAVAADPHPPQLPPKFIFDLNLPPPPGFY